MRDYKEIYDASRHDILKSDIFKSALLELYTFLNWKDLPEFFVKSLPEGAEKVWSIDENAEEKDLCLDIKDERHLLSQYMDNSMYKEVAYRLPRLIILFWVYGVDISVINEIDKRLVDMLPIFADTVVSDKSKKKRLNSLLSFCDEISNIK